MRTASIATGDSQLGIKIRGSFELLLKGLLRWVLSLVVEKSLLRRPDILQRKGAGLDQMGDDRAACAAEQSEQVVDQFALSRCTGHGCFEDECRANLLNPAQGLFRFKPVDHRLHGAVGQSLACREGLVNLPDGAGPFGPESLHNRKLQFAQLWEWQSVSLLMSSNLLHLWLLGKRFLRGGARRILQLMVMCCVNELLSLAHLELTLTPSGSPAEQHRWNIDIHDIGRDIRK